MNVKLSFYYLRVDEKSITMEQELSSVQVLLVFGSIQDMKQSSYVCQYWTVRKDTAGKMSGSQKAQFSSLYLSATLCKLLREPYLT